MLVCRLLGCLVLASVVASPLWADEAATELVRKSWERFRAPRSERESIEILVLPGTADELPRSAADAARMLAALPQGATHKRAERYVLFADDDRDKIHIRFSHPAEDAGLSFLVWAQPDSAADDMWLYMPGYRNVRRVAFNSGQRLAGTDLIYEDVRQMAGEIVERFEYEHGAEETLDGTSCTVVVATPLTSTRSAYGKRKIWFDRDSLFPLRIDYFDTSGTLWKQLRNYNVHDVGGARRPEITAMRDFRAQRTTLLWAAKRQVGISIPNAVFSQDSLNQPLL